MVSAPGSLWTRAAMANTQTMLSTDPPEHTQPRGLVSLPASF